MFISSYDQNIIVYLHESRNHISVLEQPQQPPNELAVGEIRKLAAALARRSGKEEKEARSHLFQKLSILLVRGNAALFVNRIPDNVESHIDGQM